MPSRTLLEIEPDYGPLLIGLEEGCSRLTGLRLRSDYADLLADALDAGREYSRAYAEAKRRIGAVDSDDIIRAALSLFRQPAVGEWIRFTVDESTQHLLIDEAQDASWKHWTIIRNITDEFFVGQGAEVGHRTLFAVGDYKQAISGDRDCDPTFFYATFSRYTAMAENRNIRWLSLNRSFRTTKPVLEFVDAALRALPAPGMGELSDFAEHSSLWEGPGTVTLLPLTVADRSDLPREGCLREANRLHAARIARMIKGWLADGFVRERGRRLPLRPGDVMIWSRPRRS